MVSPSHGGPVSAQVLEVCVNHCGEKFHNEVAKFRFLNELIKVLSPKVSTLGLALLAVPCPPAFKCLSPFLVQRQTCSWIEPASLSQVCES